MNILVAIANYGNKNRDFLETVIKEYRSMPHQVDIVVFSNIPKDLGPGIEVIVGLPSPNPWSLPFAHKRVFAERANDYDLFIYTEDDTLVTEQNIRAFLEVTRVLPENEIAGFMRYEVEPAGRKYYSTVHSHFHWLPESVRTIGEYAFARFTNDHSACYVLTQKQLRMAIDSGGYLVGPHDKRYDLLVTAATDPYTQCGLTKVICISHFQDFVVHHLPDIYIGKLGVESAEFHRQIATLLKNVNNGNSRSCFFPVETGFKQAKWSKSYYERCRDDVVAIIPGDAKDLLSVGCGWGATEEALVRKGHRVAAVPLDPVIGACAEAKGVEVVSSDFEEAYETLARRRFDGIIFTEVLQHLRDPEQVLSRFAQLLTENGIVIISAPNFNSIRMRKDLLSDGIPACALNSYDRTALHLTTKRMVGKWLGRCGMNVDHARYGFEGRSRKVARLTMGLLNGLLAESLVVVGSKSTAEGMLK